MKISVKNEIFCPQGENICFLYLIVRQIGIFHFRFTGSTCGGKAPGLQVRMIIYTSETLWSSASLYNSQNGCHTRLLFQAAFCIKIMPYDEYIV